MDNDTNTNDIEITEESANDGERHLGLIAGLAAVGAAALTGAGLGFRAWRARRNGEDAEVIEVTEVHELDVVSDDTEDSES